MEDWQAGAGLDEAESGGYLFGTVDSRVPHQLILPPGAGVGWDVAFNSKQRLLPTDLTSFGVTANIKAAGVEVIWVVNAKVAYTVTKQMAFYANIPDGSTITIKYYDALNTTLLSTITFTAESFSNGMQWYVCADGYNFVAGTDYYVRVSVNADWSVYTSNQYSKPFFIFQFMNNGLYKTIRFNNNLYGFNQYGMFKWNGSYWATVAGAPAVILMRWCITVSLYLAVGPGTLHDVDGRSVYRFRVAGVGAVPVEWLSISGRNRLDLLYGGRDDVDGGRLKQSRGAGVGNGRDAKRSVFRQHQRCVSYRCGRCRDQGIWVW